MTTQDLIAPVKSASAERGHKEAAVAFVTYDGSVADLNRLAEYVTKLEAFAAALARPDSAAPAGVEWTDEEIREQCPYSPERAQAAIWCNGFREGLAAAPKAPAAEQEARDSNNPRTALAIEMLVTAGHVSREKADEAYQLACNLIRREAAQPPSAPKADERGSAEPVELLRETLRLRGFREDGSLQDLIARLCGISKEDGQIIAGQRRNMGQCFTCGAKQSDGYALYCVPCRDAQIAERTAEPQGLTDAEVEDVYKKTATARYWPAWKNGFDKEDLVFARAIEAALAARASAGATK